MRISFQKKQDNFYNHLSFNGKSETFWRVYNKNLSGVPLKDTIIKSITDSRNLLGEGLRKKGFNLVGLKDYVIRIYKDAFNIETLNENFLEPSKEHMNTLEGVVLSIPNKIDIVKKKFGIPLGIANYAKRLHVHEENPLENVNVTREETLQSLHNFEQLKDFPLKSYERAYNQIKKFCKKTGYQFDILSPNNILVDFKNKQINLIDPVSPIINKGVHGEGIEFSKIHGCDSLYFTLCDFLLQQDHLKNLTPEEKSRWQDAISTIVAKCISAGQSVGFSRNIDKLRVLYANIDRFWGTEEICRRYDSFVETFSSAIKQEDVIENAVNYKNSEQSRIKAIKQINSPKFQQVKPVFEKILIASHQPKVEFPEIIDAVLDRIFDYGKDAKSIMPFLETLFDKEIFYTTKKRLYNLFINISPENQRFLEEIEKSASNIFEKNLYREEFKNLYKIAKASGKNVSRIKALYEQSLVGEKLSQHIIDKLWISRSCINAGIVQRKSLDNMLKAYNYIESNKGVKLSIQELIKLHKIVLADMPEKSNITGRLRTPETDVLIKQVFNIQKDTTNTVCDYSASKDVVNDLKKMEEYVNENYDKLETFNLAAYIFSELIRIHPFLDANGRTARLFTEQFLLNKGYRLMKWPEQILYRKVVSVAQVGEALRECSVKI